MPHDTARSNTCVSVSSVPTLDAGLEAPPTWCFCGTVPPAGVMYQVHIVCVGSRNLLVTPGLLLEDAHAMQY